MSLKNHSSFNPEFEESIKKLERIIDMSVDDPLLFIRALRHRSSLADDEQAIGSYERLEFLGDAVLELFISEFLFNRFPQKDEGFLTKLRAKLVMGDTLALYARELSLSDLIIIGKGAEGQGIRQSVSTLADVFESLLGAIYVTKGYETAAEFVRRTIEKAIDLDEITAKSRNYKSSLLEYAQARGMDFPRYKTISERGPDHDKTFRVKVLVDKKKQGRGTGKTKKGAEQQAAREALEKLKHSG